MEYELELSSASAYWRDYTIYISLVGFDAAGARVCFGAWTHAPGAEGTPPQALQQPALARCGPCVRAEGHVSIIAAALPASGRVTDSPPFTVELTARAGGRELFRRTCEVNRWGGLSLAGIRLEA